MNAKFFGVVRRSYCLLHAAAPVVLHQLYYAYGTLCYAWCVIERAFPRR